MLPFSKQRALFQSCQFFLFPDRLAICFSVFCIVAGILPYARGREWARQKRRENPASFRALATCCHLAEGSAAAAADEQGFRRHERALALVEQAERAAFQHTAAGGRQVLL
jgi:hypothetical protein